jgi:RNase H-fold protein (predicted Holliday junction resolvase)
MKELVIAVITSMISFIIGYKMGTDYSKRQDKKKNNAFQDLINAMIHEHTWRMRSEEYTPDEEDKFVEAISKKTGHSFVKRGKKE